jgi:hypothetical protein
MKNPKFIKLDTPCDGLNVQRNFQCPVYNDCLTDAAFRNLNLLCCDCSLKDSKQNLSITECEISKCISLIEALFVFSGDNLSRH